MEIAELRRGGFDVSADLVETGDAIREYLAKNSYDVVLADYSLTHFRGMETLDIMREQGLSVPLILVTGALKSVTASSA